MSASISKFHTGSKIINADTQTDIGTILHDGSLKTVNGVSLVGSGDAPVGAKFLGALATSGTLSGVANTEYIYYIVLFEENGITMSAIVELVNSSGAIFVTDSNYDILEFSIFINTTSGNISLDATGDPFPCKIYGVKGVS